MTRKLSQRCGHHVPNSLTVNRMVAEGGLPLAPELAGVELGVEAAEFEEFVVGA